MDLNKNYSLAQRRHWTGCGKNIYQHNNTSTFFHQVVQVKMFKILYFNTPIFKAKLLVFGIFLFISCLTTTTSSIPETNAKLSKNCLVQTLLTEESLGWFPVCKCAQLKKCPGHDSRTMIQEKEEFPGLVNTRGKTQGTRQGKSGHSVTLECVCTYTQQCMHTSVSSLPCLAPASVGRASWRNIPSREQLLKDLTWHFYIQLTACNIPLKKKNPFVCLKRHKDNIHVYDPDCLWSRGREIVQTALLSSTPGCPPDNSAAVSEERGRSLSPRLTLLAGSLANCWEGDRHERDTFHLWYWCTQQNHCWCPKSGERTPFSPLENLIPRSLAFPFLLYHCCPPNSYTTTLFKYLPKHSYLFSTLWLHVHVGWKSYTESYLNTASSFRYCLGNQLYRDKQHYRISFQSLIQLQENSSKPESNLLSSP